jgi:predicted DNA binding protein
MYRAKLYLTMETDCVLSEVTSRWDDSFAVTQEEVLDDEFIRFLIDGDDHVEELVEAFEASDQVREIERLDDTRITLTKRSCGALPIIRANHGMLQGFDRVSGTQRIFDIVVFRRRDLREIIAGLREVGSVRLGRLTPYDSPESLLSTRQTEVLEAALEAGYYEWPRDRDAQSIAADLDISHATFLEHLRKAERTLLVDALSRGGTGDAAPPDEEAFITGAKTDGGRRSKRR